MQINISEDRRITSDANQYKLEKRLHDKKRGQYYWTAYKYYSSFDAMVKSVPDQLLKESDVLGTEAAINLLIQIKDVLNDNRT